jgi:hypothetical protein
MPIFKCQWVKHPNGVSMNNYRLTLVDLKNVGHKDDPWVLVNCVAQVFYVLDLETRKHVVVSRKKILELRTWKIMMRMSISSKRCQPLFTNPMNIKHIEKYFDKNLMHYMRKGGN